MIHELFMLVFASVHGSTESAKVTKLTEKNMQISGIFLVRKWQKSDFLWIAEIFGKSLETFVRIL